MIQSRLSFKKRQKITKNNEYQKILKSGKRLFGSFIRIQYVIDEDNQNCRIGVIISRKLKGSVIRNRYKRLVREFFRLNQFNIKNGVNLAVIVTKEFKPVILTTVEKEILRLLNIAGLINKKKNNC